MASPAKRPRTDSGPASSLHSPSSKSSSPRGRGRGRGRASPRAGRARGGASGGARGGRTSASSSTKSTPNSSPSKKRNGTSTAAASSKPIYSFFNASVLQNRLQEEKREPDEIDRAIEEDFIDDVIDDDSPDEAYVQRAKTENGKPKVNGVNGKANGHPPAKRVHASQAFVEKAAQVAAADDGRPWADRFPPRSLEELAVHKKKVEDVKSWFEAVYSGHSRKRLLVLKGAAGAGKTATVSLLANELGVDILEWRNPSGAEVSSDGYFSASAQFEEFLFRGRKYSALEFDNEPTPSRDDPDRYKMIVVEEFPNTFNRSSSVLRSFQNTIKLFLASNTPKLQHMFSQHQQDPVIPLVLIVSETLLTTTSAAADSFTAHRLLGPEILNHAGTELINFNPVAPTLLSKALELVVQKESQVSGRKSTPSRTIWEKLGQVGDIRSAISSLEFMMLRGDEGGNWSGRVKPANSKKRIRDDGPLTEMEKESIEMITQREASLGMFHAVGKIVWNKRHPADTENIPPVIKPPDHLRHQDRELCSMVAVNDLIDEIGTSTQIFISALHENCLLSCHCPLSSTDSIEAFNGCIDALSDSDLLAPNWDGGFGSGGMGGGFGRGAFQGAAQDSLRQDEVSFQVACRGILFSLPLMVKRIPPPVVARGNDSRWNRPNGGKGDAFKMFYPMGLRLWRVQEEIESLVDHWISKILKGLHIPPPKVQRKSASITPMQAWRSPNKAPPQQNAKPLVATAPEFIPSKPLNTASSPETISIIPRLEALLERLPYLYHLHSASHTGSASSLHPPSKSLKDLEKISQLRGVNMNAMSDEVPSDEEDLQTASTNADAADASWTTDRPMESGATPKKKKGVGPGAAAAATEKWRLFGKTSSKDSREESLEENVAAASGESKGWLSEDDIVDD